MTYKDEKKEILVLASDQRLIFAGELLKEKGYNVTIVAEECDREALPNTPDCVLLPIRGTADGTVQLIGGTVDLKDYLEALPKDTLIISGVKTAYETENFPNYFWFQEDANFTKGNSELTAQGIMYLLIKETPDSIFAYSYDLIGYGKVGRATYDFLTANGLNVKKIDKDTENGADSSLEEWKKSKPADVIINTAPAAVIDKSLALSWGKEVYVIDVASGAVGATKEAKEYENIHYIAAPPLPGLVAPKGAGRLLAELVQRKMNDKE